MAKRSQRRAQQKRRQQAKQLARVDRPLSRQDPALPGRLGAASLALSVEQSLYSGPIPQASEMRGYEDAVPGLASEIVAMAVRQAKHRQRLETWDMLLEHFHVTMGQLCALAVALFFGYIAYDLGRNGEPALGGVIGVVDLVALVGLFIYEQRRSER